MNALNALPVDADVRRAGAADEIFPVRDGNALPPEAHTGPGLGLVTVREHRTDTAQHDHKRENDQRIFGNRHAVFQKQFRIKPSFSQKSK